MEQQTRKFVKCFKCGSFTYKRGKTRSGKQRYTCANSECGYTFSIGEEGSEKKSLTKQCKWCKKETEVKKLGFTIADYQRYRCKECNHTFSYPTDKRRVL